MCSGPLITNCLVCSPADNRMIQNPEGLCICNTGFIDIGIPLCGVCHYSCLSCNAPISITGCNTCHPPSNYRVSTPISGACSCIQGYYDDGINVQCGICHYSCETCSSALINNCSTCNLPISIRTLSAANECLCNTGYYDAGVSICVQCHYSCQECSGVLSNQCLKCDDKANRIAIPN
jgi:proprotein convertase subtilisin/kexin type 5